LRTVLRKYFAGVRFTIIKTIGITLLLFLCGFIIFQFINKEQINLTRRNQENEIAMSFNSMLNLKSEFYESILVDYACFDWMIEFVNKPSKYDPSAYITPTKQLNLSMFQVYNLHQNVVYVDNSGIAWRDTLVFNKKFFRKLFVKRKMSFFVNIPEGLLEVHASTIHKSSDINKVKAPEGYVVIGKLWTDKYVEELSAILNARITISNDNPDKKKHYFALKGTNNRPICYLSFHRSNTLEDTLVELKRYLNIFFILLCMSILLLSLITYERAVLKPLSCIEKALDLQSPVHLEKIIKQNNEFSKIAMLIVNYFSQKELTTSKISELQKAKDELKFLYSTLLSQKSEIELQKEELKANSENLANANEQILKQKYIVEDQNQQITDSMVYASMIQNAVLTPQFNLGKVFAESFILFQPKGIVSGDFNWFKESKGKYFFACADCTGHGLSGALMSMLGISNLNEITANFNHETMDAASILNILRANIVNTLHQTGEIGEIHDGMDIVLCVYDPKRSIIDFGAAYNSLYHLTADEAGQVVLTEHKGDNMPVGIHDRTNPFMNRRIELKKGDSIYLFTDGFLDQFGEQEKKKFNKNNFKALILSVQDLSMEEQKNIISRRFNDWKGDVEQIDDVSVIGIKF